MQLSERHNYLEYRPLHYSFQRFLSRTWCLFERLRGPAFACNRVHVKFPRSAKLGPNRAKSPGDDFHRIISRIPDWLNYHSGPVGNWSESGHNLRSQAPLFTEIVFLVSYRYVTILLLLAHESA
jgi:hypothetical protein